MGVTPAPLTPLTKAYIQGGRELGYPYVDYNGPEQLGKVARARTCCFCLSMYVFNPQTSREKSENVMILYFV